MTLNIVTDKHIVPELYEAEFAISDNWEQHSPSIKRGQYSQFLRWFNVMDFLKISTYNNVFGDKITAFLLDVCVFLHSQIQICIANKIHIRGCQQLWGDFSQIWGGVEIQGIVHMARHVSVKILYLYVLLVLGTFSSFATKPVWNWGVGVVCKRFLNI